jgi:hypothetical protein
MLVTCGMRNVGPGSEEGWETFGLHGEVSYCPASSVASRGWWEDSSYHIEITGDVVEAYPLGPHLRLQRRWKTQLGANWLELEDTVTNEGFGSEIHMQLYHWNFGFPLLNEKSQLLLTTDKVVARDAAAKKGLGECSSFELPTENFAEQVFFHSYEANSPEITSAMLISDRESSDFAAELCYSAKELPYLTQWKLCGKGNYVLGVEPGNCLVEGREWHREQRIPALEPGHSAHARLRLTIYDEKATVAAAAAKYKVN